MKRGEVWLAKLADPIGKRPVLLLSRDAVYQIHSRAYVTVGLITSTIRGIPTEVELDQRDGLRNRCVVNLDDILTMNKDYLERYLATLLQEKMLMADRAIAFALGMTGYVEGPSRP